MTRTRRPGGRVEGDGVGVVAGQLLPRPRTTLLYRSSSERVQFVASDHRLLASDGSVDERATPHCRRANLAEPGDRRRGPGRTGPCMRCRGPLKMPSAQTRSERHPVHAFEGLVHGCVPKHRSATPDAVHWWLCHARHHSRQTVRSRRRAGVADQSSTGRREAGSERRIGRPAGGQPRGRRA